MTAALRPSDAFRAAPRVAPRMRTVYRSERLHVELRAIGRGALAGAVVGLAPGEVTVAWDARDEAPGVGEIVALAFQVGGVPRFSVAATVLDRTRRARAGGDVHEARLALGDAAPRASLGPELRIAGFHAPAAHAVDPFFFHEPLHLRVVAAAPRGLVVQAAAPAGSLVPGLPLTLTVHLAGAGAFPVRARVIAVDPATDEIALAYEAPSPGFAHALAELLLRGAGATLRGLRDAGFDVGPTESALVCGYADTEDDMREVLALRLAAYHSKDKFKYARTAEDMRDRYDAHARQIVVRVGGRIVGAVRLVFLEGRRERSEQTALGAELPAWAFERRCGEISRLCTHPDFRGSDVLIAVLRHLGRVAIQADLDHMLASCDDQCAFYARLGFEKVGVTYDAYGRKGIDVIHVRLQDYVDGNGMSPLVWERVHRPMIAYLREKGAATATPLGRVRMRVHAALGRPLRALADAAMNRQRARRAEHRGCACRGQEKAT